MGKLLCIPVPSLNFVKSLLLLILSASLKNFIYSMDVLYDEFFIKSQCRYIYLTWKIAFNLIKYITLIIIFNICEQLTHIRLYLFNSSFVYRNAKLILTHINTTFLIKNVRMYIVIEKVVKEINIIPLKTF